MVRPYQKVVIQSNDKGTITMDGLVKVGSLSVPTRAFIDAFSSITFNGVTIKAITSADLSTPIQDMNSLFVLRSLDAAGHSKIAFNGCNIRADVHIVNAGGSSSAHVKFIETRVSNESRMRNVSIHPVTAFSGGYEQGSAFVSKQKVTLSNQVSWLEDQNINEEDDE